MKHIAHLCYIFAVVMIVMAVLGQVPSLIAVVLTVGALALGNGLAKVARNRFNRRLADAQFQAQLLEELRRNNTPQ